MVAPTGGTPECARKVPRILKNLTTACSTTTLSPQHRSIRRALLNETLCLRCVINQDNPRGCIIGEKEGFLKLIFRREDLKLLGVHAIGEIASELVHIGMIAMAADCDATVFGELSFNVPTLGALYQDATWRLINERRRAVARAIG